MLRVLGPEIEHRLMPRKCLIQEKASGLDTVAQGRETRPPEVVDADHSVKRLRLKYPVLFFQILADVLNAFNRFRCGIDVHRRHLTAESR